MARSKAPVITIEYPEMLVAAERVHNKMLRDITREALDEHAKKRLPLHFTSSARTRYNYMPRISKMGRKSYDYWKQVRLGVNAPLVKTGNSKAYILNPANRKITVTGSASKGTLVGNLRTKFPFGGGTGKRREGKIPKNGAIPSVLVQEVQRIIPDEQREINAFIKQRYTLESYHHNAQRKRKVRSNVRIKSNG